MGRTGGAVDALESGKGKAKVDRTKANTANTIEAMAEAGQGNKYGPVEARG